MKKFQVECGDHSGTVEARNEFSAWRPIRRARCLNEPKRMPPIQERGLWQIQTEYPTAHIEPGPHGEGLIVVPGFKLCSGWLCERAEGGCEPANICTVLFLRPCGFPAARPEHFWTDIRLRLSDRSMPQCTNQGNLPSGFPQWKNMTWFSWHLQMWDPNRDSLYTYLKVIHQRLKPAR